jgi:TIR domain
MPEKFHRELKLFFCYAHPDKTLREKLDKHLSSLKRQYNLTTWSDHEILPGDSWQQTIQDKLSDADIILLLISPDFFSFRLIPSTRTPAGVL